MRLQTRQMLLVMAVMVGMVMGTGSGFAQAPAAQQKAEPVVVPLQVTVVITRYKSDKAQTVVSRMPFEVWVNSGSSSTVIVDSQVPVPTTTLSTSEGSDKQTAVASYSYRSVGTQLTVEARALANGLFSIAVSINDSQILPPPTLDPNIGGARAGTQTHRAQATTIARDGQTVQHSLATDRVTGDITKVDVTLNVVK